MSKLRLMNTETVSVSRPDVSAPVVNAQGYIEKGTPTEFDVICNIQPLTGKALLALPTQDRDRASLNMWSSIEIFNRDRVTRKGLVYQARVDQDWKTYHNLRTQHYHAVLYKIENQDIV